MQNLDKSITKSNIVSTPKFIKSNFLFFTALLNNTQKKNILFAFSKNLSDQDNLFLNILDKNNFSVIPRWSEGLITNYHQMAKSYKNKLNYNFLTAMDLESIQFIILNFVPEKNSSFYNELLILKTYLNIKIICFVNIKTLLDKKNSIIDIPLFYAENQNDFYPDLNFLHFYLINFFKKKIKCF